MNSMKNASLAIKIVLNAKIKPEIVSTVHIPFFCIKEIVVALHSIMNTTVNVTNVIVDVKTVYLKNIWKIYHLIIL